MKTNAGRVAGSGMRRAWFPVAAVAALTFLVACSGAAAPADAPALPAPTAGPIAAPVGAPGGVQTGPSQPGDGNGAPLPSGGPLIVRTGTLELQSKDVDAVVARARDFVTSMGGYVAGSDESNKGDQRIATITYRIPVDRWQDAITGLRGLADAVVREQTKADEVTAQVVDLNARLDNLHASEASLRDIMARAGTITDVLAVQDKQSAVREQIEQLTARQQDLTGRAALGTLDVTWETPVPAVAQVQSGWDLAHEIDHAAAQTVSAAQHAASFGIWLLIVGVPVFGPLVLVFAFLLWLFRRWDRRRLAAEQAAWGPTPPGSAPPPAAG